MEWLVVGAACCWRGRFWLLALLLLPPQLLCAVYLGAVQIKVHTHPLVCYFLFCQSAIENAQKDQAAVVQNILDNKESHVKKIRALFSKLGADHTGKITYEMLKEHIGTPAMRVYFESLDLDVSDAWSFFKLLDEDGGGAIEMEEFLLGCLRLRGQARALDIAKLMYDQNWLVQSQGKFQLLVEESLQALTNKVMKMSLLLRKDEAEEA